MNGDSMNTSNIMQEVMGNIPVAGPGKGMMGGGGGLVPPTLLEESRVPKFYLDAIVGCGATNSSMLPHTALVYNLMVRSGLQRSELSYVWSAVNRTLPGQLTRSEFFSCLALIALAQKGESLAALSSMSQLPIPVLQSVPTTGSQIAAPIVNVSSRNVPQANTPKPTTRSSFLPTSLLPRKFQSSSTSNTPVNTSPTDLLGDILTPTTANSCTNQSKPSNQESLSSKVVESQRVSPQPQEVAEVCTEKTLPNHDWVGIDWGNNSSPVHTKASPIKQPTQTIPTNTLLSSDQTEILESIILAISSRFKEYEVLFKDKSASIIKEVFETEKGDNYLRCLFHAWLILNRAKETLSTNSSPYITTVIKDCERIWKMIEIYLDDSQKSEESEKGMDNVVCSICYQSASTAVKFAGKSYHADCANLWVNTVRPVLP